jgi:hypothetical protein
MRFRVQFNGLNFGDVTWLAWLSSSLVAVVLYSAFLLLKYMSRHIF